MRSKRIPKKLKQDAIIEAILEIRFDMTTIAEVLFGRLAEHSPWKDFQQRRMPAYDIPPSMRQADPNLRYQPVFELTNAKDRAVRLGAQVLSYHGLPAYSGWEEFRPELFGAIDALFAKADGLTVRRLGLRYINALQRGVHFVDSVTALDLKILVEEEIIRGYVNLNFTTNISNNTECTVRIATKEFVQGGLPVDTSVLVDVDVYTKESFRSKSATEVKEWVEFAHTAEKRQFFRLLTEKNIEALEVKEN